MPIPIKTIKITPKNYKRFGFPLLIIGSIFLLLGFFNYILGLIGFIISAIAWFIFWSKGTKKVEGVPAAIVIGSSFILGGTVFIFIGQSERMDVSGLIWGGIGFCVFGIAVIIWEGCKYRQCLKK